MPTDEQYVAELNAANPAPAAEVAPAPEAPTPEPQVETFALGDHKFPVNTEFNLTHGNQVKKVPYSTLVNTYRQASHLEDKYKKFNTESEAFKAQQAEYEKLKQFHGKYGALQEWSESKPEEFQTIWDLYQNKGKHLLSAQAGLHPNQQLAHAEGQLAQGQAQGLSPEQLRPFVDKISALENQLGELTQFKSQFDNEQKQKQEQADVEFVRNEMKTFQTEFPEINLQEKDPDGVNLWAKIIKYGVDNKIPTFEASALAYLKPRIIDTVSSRARNETVKGIKTAKANGEVARSSTPFKQGQTKTIDPKKVSWSEAGELAKQQYAQLIAQGN
jgi:hypothetical protein